MAILRVWVFELEIGGGDYPPPLVSDRATHDLQCGRIGAASNPELANALDVVVEPRNGGRAVQGLNYDGSPNGDPHYDMVLRGEGLLAFYRSTQLLEGRVHLVAELHADAYMGASEDDATTGVIRRTQMCTWTSLPGADGRHTTRGTLELSELTTNRPRFHRGDLVSSDDSLIPPPATSWTRTSAILVDLDLDTTIGR